MPINLRPAQAQLPADYVLAVARAFATVRREVWARRERDLRYVTDAGANWTIA